MTQASTPPCPAIDPTLLTHLRAAFRTEIEVPRTETSLWEVGSRHGKRQILEYLERKYEEQKKQDLTNVLK